LQKKNQIRDLQLQARLRHKLMQTDLEILLAVQGISKQFRPNWVLRDVSFSVKQGEVLGLIGPNGAGKTTLLETLAGLLPADAGTVSFQNRMLHASGRKKALFYLPDNIAPWAEQRLGWALAFFEKIYRRDDVRADELAQALRLEGLLNARLHSLSKGERKRALLALGLLTRQPLLLLDEPFDGLDLRQTRDVMRLLKAHAARGRTLMLSIHQLTDAARVCDRLVLLSGGKVVGAGTIQELRGQANLDEGELEEIFLALT
jgi:ABC-2 type transport system ATP-binding protein